MAADGRCLILTADKPELLTCELCQDIYRDPKLLPCGHTFCEKCLEELVQRQPQTTFPCPTCRVETDVPTEGMAGFHTNPYVHKEQLERARDDTTCLVHEPKKIDMFCMDCDHLICGDCKQNTHLHHRTDTLQNAKKVAEDQLAKDKVRLRKMREHLEQMTPERRTNLEEYQSKKALIKKKILQRHATMVSNADKYLKESLESLEEDFTEIENFIMRELQTAQNNIEKIVILERKIDTAMQLGEDCKIVNTAVKVRTGYGSENSVRKMALKPLQQVSRVIHVTDDSHTEAEFTSPKKFIGRAKLVTYSYTQPGFSVELQTQCGNHDDSVVFCVCPVGNITYVSFERTYQDPEPCVKKFSHVDKVVEDEEIEGSVSMKRKKTDKYIYRLTSFTHNQDRSTYVKCRNSNKIYVLQTSSTRLASICKEKVVSKDPYKTKDIELFTLPCGLHRAASMDSSKHLLAVVVEPAEGDTSRQVKLFRRKHWKGPSADLTDTYQPPLSPCQPADACFFTLDKKQVLLIADELNDAIHVTEVKDDRLTFCSFLAPGSPLLVQPTALGVDYQGRLWVGCRGGRLLTVKTLQSTPPAVDDCQGDLSAATDDDGSDIDYDIF